MRKALLAAVAAVGLGLLAAPAVSAQTVNVVPGTGQGYVQYYTPYTYGSTSYYNYPNTGWMYPGGYAYSNNYVGPTVYGPGYTANYPWMYNQLNYGYTNPGYSTYYYGYAPSYTTYRTWRWR